MIRSHPFSTREVLNIFPLACLFDSLVRVTRRVKAPHFRFANIEFTENRGLAGFKAVVPRFISAQITKAEFLHSLPSKGDGPRTGRMMLYGWFWQKWRYFPCHCHDFRFYVTLFPKCFSNFRSRYLFDIGLPTLYLTLADIYLPLDTSLPRSATLLAPHNVMLGFLAQWADTFFGSILT